MWVFLFIKANPDSEMFFWLCGGHTYSAVPELRSRCKRFFPHKITLWKKPLQKPLFLAPKPLKNDLFQYRNLIHLFGNILKHPGLNHFILILVCRGWNQKLFGTSRIFYRDFFPISLHCEKMKLPVTTPHETTHLTNHKLSYSVP